MVARGGFLKLPWWVWTRKSPIYERRGWLVVWKNGYVFDRRLFVAFLGLFIAYTAIVFFWALDNQGFYVACPSDNPSPCQNPFYNEGLAVATDCFLPSRYQEDYGFLCAQEQLFPGEAYGEPVPWWVLGHVALSLCLLAIAFLANHFLRNRRFFDEKKRQA